MILFVLGLDFIKNYEAVNTGETSCGGHICTKCRKCSDWFYIGNDASLKWLQNWKNWSKSDWERYRDNDFSQGFKKRLNATCANYFCILDGDIELNLHLHSMGADAYGHCHHDLCLCTEKIRE
jgi:hypothetical protein